MYEDYSIGKLLEYYIYQTYYENSNDLTFVSFFKSHPHNPESVLRIALKPGTDLTLEVLVPSICDTIIEYLNKVSNLF